MAHCRGPDFIYFAVISQFFWFSLIWSAAAFNKDGSNLHYFETNNQESIQFNNKADDHLLRLKKDAHTSEIQHWVSNFKYYLGR